MEKLTHSESPRVGCVKRLSRRTLILLSVLLALLVIGLAVGLGVGLGLTGDGEDSDNDDDDGIPSPGPSSTPLPTPPANGSLWQPAVNSSWQIVLLNPLSLSKSATSVSPDVDIFDIDLFSNDQSTIEKLHQLGKKVICYFSAGSYESYRPDSSEFQPSDLGKELDGWPGERWLDIGSSNVRRIMAARIALAASKGCDAIDPDNVDGYSNENGLGLSEQDSIDFLQFLSNEARNYTLAIGLKNAGSIIPDVLDMMSFSVNEQCVQYSECETFAPFVKAGKPVFHIEYPSDESLNNVAKSAVEDLCSGDGSASGSTDFSTVIKNMNLNGWVEYCNGTTADTATSQ
ncbi:hypothetical protein KC343_g4567 [Hortaea werneckii]|nr:hypothetical protein KC317_g2366 [Hortaea werneckii]KAI7619639.1 hypothetical protein KC346_g4464 [Hortaea werneckii]KAI7630533.1 hypothetical protein KC343_g4567 [Hortaea werneckii]KAI7681898.1 hypothetical protein KC319_g1303 [Hortaea werneckii]KAI7693724.1 hypothetical protein KC322_g10648 [Hortaea werneckii]